MGYLNSFQLEIAIPFLIARDGSNCPGCGTLIKDLKTKIQVDHIDGNKFNNPLDGSNWGLLCGSCNVKKSWIQKRVLAVENSENVPFAYSISSKMELAWVRYMIDEIVSKGSIKWDVAINTGALEINGNPVTTKRYLMKHTSDPTHKKAIFKTFSDEYYNTLIKFTEIAEKFFMPGTETTGL